MFIKSLLKPIKQIILRLIKTFDSGLNRIKDNQIIENFEMGTQIPKIIHQTYHVKNLPEAIQTNINQLKNQNPDWEYRLYDDDDIEKYIQFYYPTLLLFYKKINPIYGAAKADFFRYLVIYKSGGVYLDIKSTLSKPLNEIILQDDCFLLSHWQNDIEGSHQGFGIHPAIKNPHGEFQQWHITSVIGHPFLKAVIENVCQNIKDYNPIFHEGGRSGVLKLTGPVAYTLAINPLLNVFPHRVERYDNDLGFTYSIFDNEGKNHHMSLFKTHYSTLKDSIVLQNKITKTLHTILNKLNLKFY